MTAEEELMQLREENRLLREQNALQKQLIERQQEHIDVLETHNRLQQQQLQELSEQVKALREGLAKDSHNSHLPPSSDRFSRQRRSLRKKSGKKSGGQEGHQGQTLMVSPAPDEVVVHAVSRCEHCQADLSQEEVLFVQRRQVVDVPASRLLVYEHQSEQNCCPQCQQITAAPFPASVRAPVQYGPRIGAIAVYLVQQQLLPLARTCEVLSDLLAVSISEGTLCDLIERCADNLVEVEQHIKEALIESSVIHQDESGLYVLGQRHWLHVTCTAQLTHYAVHRKRGKEALDAIGILPRFEGSSVHDGWRSYFLYGCSHALCLVHLLRELTFLTEEQGHSWAAELKDLLLAMKEATEQAREFGLAALHALEVEDWQAQFEKLLANADALTPTAQAPPGHKGRLKHSTARNLLDRLFADQQAVLAFLYRLVVPFDNNQAERDVRMVKVQQKVCGSFRSETGARAFCRIRGYLSTLRKQGLHLLSALEATLAGHPIFPSFQTS
jgi:transposase